MSFRVQIAVFGAIVVGLALLVFSLLLYGLAASSIGATQDRDLTQRAERLLGVLNAAGSDAFGPQRSLTAVDLAESNDTFVEVLDANGSVLSTTATFSALPPDFGRELLATAATQGSARSSVDLSPGLGVRVYVRPWARPDLGLSGFLIVGQSARSQQANLAGIRGFLWLSALFTFFAAMVAIWLVAGRALRPLLLVADTAEDIRITGDLQRRLRESRGWSELNLLARAFNGMLERLGLAQQRLEDALEAQRRFVADASHELRTPLTSIRNNAGLLLRRDDVTGDDRKSALEDIASEAERMSRLVHDLLTLARADAGQHLERSIVDLAPLVADVGRQARALYTDRDVVVDATTVPPVCVAGNADALTQLQWILLDNAARFAGPGGSVCLQLGATNGCAELSVGDDGPGIPLAERGRIFDRFYQADLARAGSGAGLGLSIARWIVAEHGGTITANDNPAGRGAVVSVAIPLAE